MALLCVILPLFVAEHGQEFIERRFPITYNFFYFVGFVACFSGFAWFVAIAATEIECYDDEI